MRVHFASPPLVCLMLESYGGECLSECETDLVATRAGYLRAGTILSSAVRPIHSSSADFLRKLQPLMNIPLSHGWHHSILT